MLSNDSLPQPGRFLNQIVMECVGEALEVIGQRMNQGDNVGKRFQPSHQGKALSVLKGPTEVFDIESGVATSLIVRYPETIVGHQDGSVGIYTTPMQIHLFSTPPLLAPASPIIALDMVSVIPAPTQGQSQLFLAATDRQLALFTFATKTDSATPETLSRRGSFAGSMSEGGVSGTSGHTQTHPPSFVSLCTVSGELLRNRKILRVTLSRCGTFAAVTFDSAEVAVVKFNGLNATSLGRSQVEPIITVDCCTFPTHFRTENLPVLPQTVFLCHPVPPSLGYLKESQQCKPLAHTLVIGWVGQNVFTTVSLKDYGTAVEKAFTAAKAQAGVVQAEVPQDVAQAKPTKEKSGGKADKGAKGTAAPTQHAEPLAVPLPPTDPLPEKIRHKLLPQILSAMALNEAEDAVGFGLFDGIVQVWKPSVGTIHSFHEAKYRAQRNNVNIMMVTSLNFTHTMEGKEILSAAISVPMIEHHSKVVFYDLKEDKALSRLNHISGWSITIPLPDLPLFVLYGSGKWYIGDILNPGTMVCEFSGLPEPLAIPTGDSSAEEMLNFTMLLKDTMCVFNDTVAFGLWPAGMVATTAASKSPTLSPEPPISAQVSKGTTPAPGAPSARVGSAVAGTSSATAPEEPKVVELETTAPTAGMAQLQYLCAVDAVLEGYPMIEKQFGGCSVVQLAHVLKQVRPADRDDPEALARVQLPSLGGFFGGAPALTRGASQASFKSGGRGATNASSFRGSTVAPSHNGGGGGLVAKSLPDGATYAQHIRFNIDQREAGRELRQQQFKQQWDLLKQKAS